MKRDILEKPFPPEQIKQREGTFGRVLDYIEGHHIIHRLNDAFDSLWSFEVLEHKILDDLDEVIVLGKLAAEGVSKSQFGSSRITRARETGAIISIADDLKAAATDSLKKCATLLGVGLQIYNGDKALQDQEHGGGGRQSDPQDRSPHNCGGNGGGNGQGRENRPRQSGQQGRTPNHRGNGGNGGNGGNDSGHGRITHRQLNYIVNLGREVGMDSKKLDEESINTYGVKMAYLTVKDASSFIENLRSM